jgi:hypothetical protein
MITTDEVFKSGNVLKIWQKYCGFLELSLDEFMDIQKDLLMEQIGLVSDSLIGNRFMPEKTRDISEFRRSVPFTTYDDYMAYLNDRDETVLPVKPSYWVHSSGRGGLSKWVPYTPRAIDAFCTYGLTTVIMACTNRRGEVNFESGFRYLQNMPPPPYISGVLTAILTEQLGTRAIPPLDEYNDADFETRIKVGFEIALRTGVDILSSLTSVLVKMGERFTESSEKMKLTRKMLQPQIMWRLTTAWLRSKREGRTILPKDLWPLKGLICYGTDTSIYREQIKYYWGKEPLEVYAATETGLVATQAWNKKGMTLIPYSDFFEFIPEEEWLKSRANKDYKPATVLLDEVEPEKRYEIVITNFYGMPFLRYRLGDLIRVVGLVDNEAGIKLPQIVFESRADDLIDIAGFPRLDEKSIWQAIANTGIKYEDWTARKEFEKDKPVVRLYIELKDNLDVAMLENLIHNELVTINRDYRDLESMLGIRPLRVVPLAPGSFQRYLEERQRAGSDLAHLKPAHMNASDSIISDLVNLNQHKPGVST